MEILLLLMSIILILILVNNSKLKNGNLKLIKKNAELIRRNSELTEKLNSLKTEFGTYKNKTEYLKKYKPIKDAEDELERLIKQMENVIQEATEEAKSIKKEARDSAKQTKDKVEKMLNEAHLMAAKIESDAKKQAESIAGEAWEAKQNADQYAETVKAMKNIIKGYGDEYLVSNHSLLDNLAEEYSHKDAGQALEHIRSIIKSMIKNGEAADCDYVEAHRKTIAVDFVLDAFNGKVDTIMAKVKHDNYGKLLQSLNDAYRIVNHNGKPFRNARISQRYFELMIEQLKLAVTVQELKKRDLEEQRQIREEIRQEEKARREFEKALKETEKEERLLEKAIKEAEKKLADAAAEERAKYEQELEQIKQKLAEAEERGQRALSMAQQTKRGHVYIISNIGSFGERVIKIGLTRRLEPLDRVKELGDASVPFSFDVHAMIHSEDAPKLEKELHNTFEKNRVNKVNYRKEFFSMPIADIKSKIETLGLETHWTMKAEATEYRESVELSRRQLEPVSE